MGLVAELKRRNVFRVAIAYLLLAWLIMQLGDVLAPALLLPDWVPSLLAFFLILGFPLALFLAWAYKLTDEGLQREDELEREPARVSRSERILNVIIIVLLAAAAGHFYWKSRALPHPTPETAATQPAGPEQAASEGDSPASHSHSVAVLPFDDVSPDSSKEYFADGITEEIMNALIRIPGLSVPARTSVFAYEDQKTDIREIGAELEVEYVIEGSVRSVGQRARITASLINVANGLPEWSQSYDRDLHDIFATQDEIARAVAEALQFKLGAVDIVPIRTANMAAYDSYLRGLAALRRRDGTAIEMLEQSTQADPGFAPAWASLAVAYQVVPGFEDRAIDAAQRALEIDPNNVDALTAMASVHRQTRQWDEAEAFYLRALEIDPGSAELLEDYAEFLNLVGQSQKALEYSERGMNIDPRIQPLAAAYAEALLSQGDVHAAREVVIGSIQAFGDQVNLWAVALPLWLTPVDGKLLPLPETELYPQASEFIRTTIKSPSAQSIESLKAVFDAGNADSDKVPVGRRTARRLLLYLGETDFVIDQDIEFGMDFPNPAREWLWTPLFKEYRAHPRFTEVLSEVGLIDFWDRTQWPAWCSRARDGEINCT